MAVRSEVATGSTGGAPTAPNGRTDELRIDPRIKIGYRFEDLTSS
jgi:hypothetical protein